MSSLSAIAEQKIAQQCHIITATDAEFWDARNKAILQMTSIIKQFEPSSVGEDAAVSGSIAAANATNIFKIIKEPVQSMILDLRSQQVRDTCQFLMKLSEVTRDQFKIFMREFFPIILEALKVPNKVMSGYVDDCIRYLIKTTTFKTAIPLLATELKENKSKPYREFCIEYVNEILLHWDIVDKEADLISDVIKLGLQDASIRVREISRLAYLNIFSQFPKKSEKIKAALSPAVAARLTKAEETFQKAKSSKSLQLEIPTNNVEVEVFPVTPSGSESTLGLRAKRQSYEVSAVTSIQAVFRGALARRQSQLPPASPIKETEEEEKGNEDETESKVIKSSSSAASSPSRPPRSPSRPLSLDGKLGSGSPGKQRSNSHGSISYGNPRNHYNNGDGDGDLTFNLSQLGSSLQQPDLPIHKLFPESSTESLSMSSNDGSHLSVGMTVEVKGRDVPSYGIVRFIGKTAFNSEGYWVGIQLSEPNGKNNGSVNGVKYFLCEEKHGLFVRPQAVFPLVFTDLSSTYKPKTATNSLSSSGRLKSFMSAADDSGPATGSNSSGTVAVSSSAAASVNAVIPPASAGNLAHQTSSSSLISGNIGQICNITKLRISLTMELLSQQLDYIDKIEKAQSNGANSSKEERMLSLLSNQEKAVWDRFHEKIERLR